MDKRPDPMFGIYIGIACVVAVWIVLWAVLAK
jgi:hypothetical protein